MKPPYPGGEWTGDVVDVPVDFPVTKSVEQFVGKVWTVQTDTVSIEDQLVDRDFVVHTGAVAIAALDEDNRIYLLRQYRHAVGMMMFEVPAGLLDVAGEDALHTAKRELAEEAGLEAFEWNVLADFFTSPGGMSETIRIFLARDLRAREGGRVLTGEAEEENMPGCWVDLDEAARLVLNGSLGNPTTVVGVLAAVTSRADSWNSLRPGDADWPTREHLIESGRVRTDVAPRH
ncbi:MAG: NUDIX hydrolase [Actinobacteria bacterium]|nr:NUDIX hydrolase [Actinomycetota bacterium]